MNAPDVIKDGLRAWATGDLDALETLLDPQVSLRWVEPGPWDCTNRDQVMRLLRKRQAERHGQPPYPVHVTRVDGYTYVVSSDSPIDPDGPPDRERPFRGGALGDGPRRRDRPRRDRPRGRNGSLRYGPRRRNGPLGDGPRGRDRPFEDRPRRRDRPFEDRPRGRDDPRPAEQPVPRRPPSGPGRLTTHCSFGAWAGRLALQSSPSPPTFSTTSKSSAAPGRHAAFRQPPGRRPARLPQNRHSPASRPSPGNTTNPTTAANGSPRSAASVQPGWTYVVGGIGGIHQGVASVEKAWAAGYGVSPVRSVSVPVVSNICVTDRVGRRFGTWCPACVPAATRRAACYANGVHRETQVVEIDGPRSRMPGVVNAAVTASCSWYPLVKSSSPATDSVS